MLKKILMCSKKMKGGGECLLHAIIMMKEV